MPARKRGERNAAIAPFKGTGMLKQTLLSTALLISTSSYALMRDDVSLPAEKVAIAHSESSARSCLADSEFPRSMSLDKYDTASGNLSPSFQGMIARRHRLPAHKSLPGTSSPASLVAGEGRAKSKTYRVRKGDTLYSIARKFHIPTDVIRAHNKISSSSALIPGQRLKIPSSKKNSEDRAKKKLDDEPAVIHSSVRFVWPLRSILSVRVDNARGVRPLGIIIEGKSGSSVLCAAKGTVEKIGTMRGYGRYIIIKHTSHFLTVYSGLNVIYVREGDIVRRCRIIGTHEGSLHFQINRAGRPIDPLELLPERAASYSAFAR